MRARERNPGVNARVLTEVARLLGMIGMHEDAKHYETLGLLGWKEASRRLRRLVGRPIEVSAVTPKRSVLESLSDEEYEALPRLSVDEMRAIVERGRQARVAAERRGR